ncbi:MAG: DUF1679 domain-containing protein [Flavobacteriales bacterium]|nr:DUF1679 domain-containing protein [Flavobacteriales bacterium]
MNPSFKKYLLTLTKSSDCEEIEVIQSLWSGYGKISRYQLANLEEEMVVVKCISLNQLNEHPRGWNTDFSHNRKVKSYEVETYWYEKWSRFCGDHCPIPKFLGSFTEGRDRWIVLEDLNTHFPLRKEQISLAEVSVCLSWLASFHSTFMNQKPEGLWNIGTYWHLDTRPDELEKMEHQELKSKAHLIDDLLNQCRYQTIVHGDAKLANFCFSEDGKKVAAVDFQYVGGGCGMKDVVYFLGSCLSALECEQYERELLDFYFSELKKGLESLESDIDFMDLEKEWRSLYPVASADFTRFLLGWMPSHQKLNHYSLRLMNEVLSGI